MDLGCFNWKTRLLVSDGNSVKLRGALHLQKTLVTQTRTGSNQTLNAFLLGHTDTSPRGLTATIMSKSSSDQDLMSHIPSFMPLWLLIAEQRRAASKSNHSIQIRRLKDEFYILED